jgi:hypothetical protein
MTKRTVLSLAAAALAALFSQTAFAQFQTPGLDLNPDGSRRYTAEEKERMQEIDKNYKESLKKVPDKQKAYDPWAGARQDSSNGSTTKQR